MAEGKTRLVYLALGSNLGDRLVNLKTAIDRLHPAVKVMDCSSVYETPPWGYLDQPAFLNMVLRGETRLSPQNLLHHIKDLEVKLGRTPAIRYGPRLIDIDILFLDDLVMNEAGLVIPHPQLHQRGFVLVPLNEIAPDMVHPVLHQPVNGLLKHVDFAGIEQFATPLCESGIP